ncbi:MAG TPA: methyltransferase domain-containing protein [Polyangiaceae bacterium]
MSDRYEGQHRGGDDAYERYLSGMDRSMRQKVAVTAAHLLGEGTVADMGMGSGSGTLALAALYPRVRVVGVDVNPEMVERARVKHKLANLSFVEGDIAAQVFEPERLDGVFNSSVLHHVTSFNGYDHDAAARALEQQVAQLAVGGSLIVRDFVAPAAGIVFLDLPANDGDGSDDPSGCSTAALFERFAREFRKLAAQPGFEYQPVGPGPDSMLPTGWRRYRVEHRIAVEFLLRKDYRSDWDNEVLEEYTYFTQSRFELEFARLGLRLLASTPVYNPWIIQHRFAGRCQLYAETGEPLPFPATNHVIVGEKVRPNEGVRFRVGEAHASVEFLIRHCFLARASGSLRDLVRRPGTTIDIVPWFRDAGSVYVVARKSHPRPVLQALPEARALDGATAVGYVTEPILALQTDEPLALTVETALAAAAELEPEAMRSLVEVATYYPSPGGLIEEVRAVHVEIDPRYVDRDVANQTGFSTAGSLRAIDARQVLRAAQVGGLPDVRLELNVYELLARQNLDLGPWIGADLAVPEIEGPPGESFGAVSLPRRRAFVPAPAGASAGFLRLECRLFAELDSSGNVLHEEPREFVVPETLSCNTLACCVLRRHGAAVLIGLDADDLAAAQCFTGSSALWVTPAWRLPDHIVTYDDARAWVEARLDAEYGVGMGSFVELGGRYHPSAGVTPEIVYPFAVPAADLRRGERALVWVPLRDVVSGIADVRDGHLRIAALRAAHALGVLQTLDATS